jgi:Transposase
VARPTKLNDEVQERIVAEILAGGTHAEAATAGGINAATFYQWTARGAEKPTSVYGRFARAVAEAEAERERMAPPVPEGGLVRILEAAARNGSIRAAQWLLERQWPERWGPASARPKAVEVENEQEPTDPFAALDELAVRREARPAAG